LIALLRALVDIPEESSATSADRQEDRDEKKGILSQRHHLLFAKRECQSEKVPESEKEEECGVYNNNYEDERDKRMIDLLSEGCQRAVLNVDFLLGQREMQMRPFLDGGEAEKWLKDPLRTLRKRRKSRKGRKRKQPIVVVSGEKVALSLRSAKMRGLKDLLCAEKLNASAIQLQLTAQSQTEVGNKGNEEGRPKRARRE